MTRRDQSYRYGVSPVRTPQAGETPGSRPQRSPPSATGGPFVLSCGAHAYLLSNVFTQKFLYTFTNGKGADLEYKYFLQGPFYQKQDKFESSWSISGSSTQMTKSDKRFFRQLAEFRPKVHSQDHFSYPTGGLSGPPVPLPS